MQSRVTAVVVAAVTWPTVAFAWQFSSPISHGCHEQITRESLAEVGYAGIPPVPSGDDAGLPASLQFDVTPEDPNMFAWSLAIGSRYPDEHGHSVLALADLNGVHNALNGQHEHCLRSPDQDGPGGDAAALKACRDFIESQYWNALAARKEDGTVDPDAREPFPVHVPGVGTQSLPLSTFYVHAGIALHTIQDSFTHLFRTGDDLALVQHVFNWSDQIACQLDEGTDGHPHESIMDKCKSGDETPTTRARFAAARKASQEFLGALTEPGSNAAHAGRISRFLDRWFTLESGCTFDNLYCAHPDEAWLTGAGKSEASEPCNSSCDTTGTTSLALLALAGGLLRRRRSGWIAGLVAAAALFLAPSPVVAEEPVAQPAPAVPTQPAHRNWGIGIRGGASLLQPTLSLGVEALMSPTRGTEISFLLELNPWITTERLSLSAGLLNGAFGFRFVVPLPGGAQWRPGFALGLSRLQASFYGIPGGRTGPYISLRPMGLEVPLGEEWTMVVDALDLVLAVPSIAGIPLLQVQHRVSFGFHYYF